MFFHNIENCIRLMLLSFFFIFINIIIYRPSQTVLDGKINNYYMEIKFYYSSSDQSNQLDEFIYLLL